MTPALFWVLLFIGYLLAYPIAWRIGYWAGRRDYSELPAEDWDEHVDQALAAFKDQASKVTPDDWDEAGRRARMLADLSAVTARAHDAAAKRRHPSNIKYLRDRRDKIE